MELQPGYRSFVGVLGRARGQPITDEMCAWDRAYLGPEMGLESCQQVPESGTHLLMTSCGYDS